MLQHVQISVTHSLGSIPPQPHEPSVPATVPLESSSVLRKRPLIPSDRTIRAPRAIQPRPATSTASYSSESGASALLSPSSESVTARGEPPRKRGRPSKAESERRKAAAEARGETYPPPRRSGSHKLKVSSTPTSPSGVAPGLPSFSPQASSSRPQDLPRHEMHYVPPPGRPIPLMGPSSDERPRDMPNQDMSSSMRELPLSIGSDFLTSKSECNESKAMSATSFIRYFFFSPSHILAYRGPALRRGDLMDNLIAHAWRIDMPITELKRPTDMSNFAFSGLA
ncbi:hypothetical protein AnigIFM50267_011475 [Aspergillus niger]|nr:hypothetical protein AlacWU_02970 [Aspergillus niger]GKZ66309.1 hypothetical protein AnigIFM50267_011475 [Aspergillus niger]